MELQKEAAEIIRDLLTENKNLKKSLEEKEKIASEQRIGEKVKLAKEIGFGEEEAVKIAKSDLADLLLSDKRDIFAQENLKSKKVASEKSQEIGESIEAWLLNG